jgi:hypothetical protein
MRVVAYPAAHHINYLPNATDNYLELGEKER